MDTLGTAGVLISGVDYITRTHNSVPIKEVSLLIFSGVLVEWFHYSQVLKIVYSMQ